MLTGQKAMEIAERIRRCRYCGREMETGALAYDENPYCVRCLDDRTRGTTAPSELLLRFRGHYVELIKGET